MFYTTQYEQQISNENECNHTKKPNKQLPEKAIRVMSAWYLAHEDNPYPNRNDLDYLATEGGIKESQVKAWFSNKRNRTQNTHPKRAKRLIRNQVQQNFLTLKTEPEKIHIADELEQRAQHLIQQQQQQSDSSFLSTSTNWSCLTPSSSSYSYDYYYPHQTHPYYYSQ